MCGFCGIFGSYKDKEALRGMMDRIIHRGPDSEGTYFGRDICLGFRRLSIVGIDGGDQPLYNEDRSLVLVFNGEIYNHKQLRTQLCVAGHVFSTQTDAEVLLHLYEEHGADMLSQLRGMFAFALYDVSHDSLFFGRDPFGIKPLYYTYVGDKLLFASEIKSFLAHPGFSPTLNRDALVDYLSFQYSPLSETFFSKVYKLMPGHHAFARRGKLDVTKYHTHAFEPQSPHMSFDEAVLSIETAVKNSVALHMDADVEVGALLSGGVDSGFLASLFGGGRTFSVGFDMPGYSEISHANALNVLARNTSELINEEEFWDILPQVQYHMDEPLADPAAVALYFVYRLAARHVKAVISGEGADELFGGYNIYKEPYSLAVYQEFPRLLRRMAGGAASLLPVGMFGRGFLMRGARTLEERYIGGANVFEVAERNRILAFSSSRKPQDITAPIFSESAHLDDITRMQHLDIHTWLHGDILLKADKMSMAHALESRVPFLDSEVFAIASRLPTAFRTTRNHTKYALRAAAARHMPNEAAFRQKLGFPVPISHWLMQPEYSKRVRLAFGTDIAQAYFNKSQLMKLLDAHVAGKRDNARKIWTVYMFLVWHNKFLGGGK